MDVDSTKSEVVEGDDLGEHSRRSFANVDMTCANGQLTCTHGQLTCAHGDVTCAQCCLVFKDVVSLIQHRVSHSSPTIGLSCDLCGHCPLGDVTSLCAHYDQIHGVHLAMGETSVGETRHGHCEGNSGSDTTLRSNGCDVVPRVSTVLCDERLLRSKHDPVSDLNEPRDVIDIDGGVCLKGDNESEDDIKPLSNSNGEMIDTKVRLDDEHMSDCGSDAVIEEGGNTTEGNSFTKPLPGRRPGRRPRRMKHDSGWDFYFRRKTNVINDLDLSYTRFTLECLHCDFEAKTRKSMFRHMSGVHSDCGIDRPNGHDENWTGQADVARISDYSAQGEDLKQATRDGGRNSRRFSCSQCPWSFQHKQALVKHMIVHDARKDFVCSACGKAFKTHDNLNQHMRTHSKVAFTCDQCSFTSNVKSAIRDHRQVHAHGGCVVCDVCATVYTCKSTLQKHMRVHDSSRLFACPAHGCTWRFKSERTCAAHFKGHGAVNHFFCAVCGCSFRHQHHLRRHERHMHNIDVAAKRRRTVSTQRASVVLEDENDHSDGIILQIDQSDMANIQSDQSLLRNDGQELTDINDLAQLTYNVAVIPQTLLSGPDTIGSHDVVGSANEITPNVLPGFQVSKTNNDLVNDQQHISNRISSINLQSSNIVLSDPFTTNQNNSFCFVSADNANLPSAVFEAVCNTAHNVTIPLENVAIYNSDQHISHKDSGIYFEEGSEVTHIHPESIIAVLPEGMDLTNQQLSYTVIKQVYPRSVPD